VIRGLEPAPIAQQVRIAAVSDSLLHPVEFRDGVLLHGVAQPGGQIALRVGPTDQVGHVDDVRRLIGVGHLARGLEVVVGVLEDFRRQLSKEVEDAGVLPLMLAEGLVVHEQIDNVSVTVDRVDPLAELSDAERPLAPVPVGESEGDVVAEAVVLQEQLEFRHARGPVDIVGAAIAQDVVRSFGEDRLEAADPGDRLGHLVVVDQFGVSEDLRRLAEQVADQLPVRNDLTDELVRGEQEAQAVVVRLAQELDAAGGRQVLETGQDLRRVLGELLQHRSGDAERDFELPSMPFDEFLKDPIGRQVALARDLAADLGVLESVEVVTRRVEDRVMS